MKFGKNALFAVATIAIMAGVAWAGTGMKVNIVPNDPTADPTMTSKSKFSVKDTGGLQAKLDGVTDSGGAPATGDTSLKDTGTLTGDEYIFVMTGEAQLLGGVPFEFNLLMDVKNGKGKAKFDGSNLFGLLTGANRSIRLTGGDAYGPISKDMCGERTCATNGDCSGNCSGGTCDVDHCANVDTPTACVTNTDCLADCQTNIDTLGFSLPPATNPCIGGDQIGVAGMEIPQASP